MLVLLLRGSAGVTSFAHTHPKPNVHVFGTTMHVAPQPSISGGFEPHHGPDVYTVCMVLLSIQFLYTALEVYTYPPNGTD